MRPDLATPGTRVINQWQLGRALLGEIAEVQSPQPPIKSLFVYNANPMVVAPEQDRIARGLARDDLFTVVAEHFMTDTALYADIVLPATTALEHRDAVMSWGHFHIMYNEPAIDPLGESLPNQEMFRRLAKAMGLTDPCFVRSDEQMLRDTFDWNAPALAGVTYESLVSTMDSAVAMPGPVDLKRLLGLALVEGALDKMSGTICRAQLDEPVAPASAPLASLAVPAKQ